MAIDSHGDLSLALVILAVEDVKRSVDFYRAALGYAVQVETPVYVELTLPDGRGLGIYQRNGFARNTGRTAAMRSDDETTATELYFRTSNVREAIERLEQAGATLLSALKPRDWGDEAAYYADPDGNVVVVARPLS